MISGLAVSTPGGFVVGSAGIAEIIRYNSKLKEVLNILNNDRSQSIRIAILITRARREGEMADDIGVSQEDATKIFLVMVRGICHILPAVTIGQSIAYGMVRAASTDLNVAGAVLSGIMIPIDKAQIKAAAVRNTGVIDEVERLAEGLEIGSWSTLHSLGFHVVFLEKYTGFKTVECNVLAVGEEAIETHLAIMQLDPLRYEEGSDNSLVLYKSQEMPNRFYYERVFQVWERRKINFVRIPYQI